MPILCNFGNHTVDNQSKLIVTNGIDKDDKKINICESCVAVCVEAIARNKSKAIARLVVSHMPDMKLTIEPKGAA